MLSLLSSQQFMSRADFNSNHQSFALSRNVFLSAALSEKVQIIFSIVQLILLPEKRMCALFLFINLSAEDI